jgi:hypothetical protein
MLRDATITRNSIEGPVEATSRRAILTMSAELLGATAPASGAALRWWNSPQQHGSPILGRSTWQPL